MLSNSKFDSFRFDLKFVATCNYLVERVSLISLSFLFLLPAMSMKFRMERVKCSISLIRWNKRGKWPCHSSLTLLPLNSIRIFYLNFPIKYSFSHWIKMQIIRCKWAGNKVTQCIYAIYPIYPNFHWNYSVFPFILQRFGGTIGRCFERATTKYGGNGTQSCHTRIDWIIQCGIGSAPIAAKYKIYNETNRNTQ